jgi:phosphatidylglycerol:prolipoprotein diacylglycerol transferase
VWYGLGRAAIEGLRTDSLYFFGTGIRSSQMLGLFSALAAVALMAIRRKTAGPATPPTVPASVKAGEKAEEGAEPPKTEQDDTDDT